MQARSWNIGAIALCALALALPAAARDLTVVSWGGAYQDAQRDAYFKPFMQKTGVRMAEEIWDEDIDELAQTLSSSPTPNMEIYVMNRFLIASAAALAVVAAPAVATTTTKPATTQAKAQKAEAKAQKKAAKLAAKQQKAAAKSAPKGK